VIAPLVQSVRVPGLGATHQDVLTGLISVIQRKAHRNRLKQRYYDHKNVLRDLGISIPPHLRSVEVAVGWPAKAVDAMSRRTVLDSFTLTSGGDPDDLGLGYVWSTNRMNALLPQTHTSALIHSTAFGFVTAGDMAAGEPEVLITTRSAEWASGVWSPRLRSLTSALSIISTDETGSPDHMVLYLPNLAIVMRREGNRWDIRQSVHDLGMDNVEALPYRPALDRPFGRSRISRPVMSLTDSVVRSLLRTEVGAEFYNAPQRYALGAEEGAFVAPDGTPRTGWQIILGQLLALSRDEDGNLPTVGQFAQQSMEPNISEIRMLAQMFASETNLPLRSLAIVGDNPESADAITEANKELELDIRHWEDSSLGPAWERLVTSALRMIDDSPAARAQYAGLRAHWRNPTTVSLTASGDWLVKVGSAVPGLAETSVGLEMAGLTGEQIDRYQSERTQVQSRQRLDALLTMAQSGAQQG